MPARSFEKTSLRANATTFVPGYSITCSECGRTDSITSSTFKKGLSPEMIASCFRNKGWIVGSKNKRDVCPHCQVREKKIREATQSQENNVVKLVTSEKISAAGIAVPVNDKRVVVEPPRAMNKEDRRLIFAKIDEVYLDQSYDNGWTDTKVALDLGVPVAWVRDIREENFGPEGINEANEKVLKEAKELLKKIEIEIGILDANLKKGERARAELVTRADALKSNLADIASKLH